MASPELTELSKNLATQNGATTPAPAAPTTTPSPAATPTTTPESTTTEPSQALKDMSIALSPKPDAPKPINRRIVMQGSNKGGGSYVQYSDGTRTETPSTGKTAADFQKDLLKASQSEINQINQYATRQIEAAKPRQEERLRETSSVSTLTGLAGSTEANRTAGVTKAVNEKENNLIRAEAQAKISGILSGVKTKALEMAQTEREQFRLDTEAASKERTARLEEAVTNAATLAASGVTYEGLQTTDPEAYQALSDAVGGPELLKAQFTLNRPQEDILDKKIEGGKYVIAYRNPLTGATRIESVDLGLPPQYTKTVDAGNRILAIPDNWSGDPAELLTINKGLTPGQQVSGASDMYGGYSDEQNKVITRVDDKVSKNDTYKKTSNMRGYVDNVTGALALGTGTGDLAAINQFQKVIDEGAVTRDQDVKLIQGSQSLINQLKTKIKGLEEGDQLSPELRSEMAAAVTSLYQAQVKALTKDPFIQSKTSELNRYGVNPNDTIIGELGAFDSNQSDVLRSPDGSQEVSTADLTPDELQEAKDAGWQ